MIIFFLDWGIIRVWLGIPQSLPSIDGSHFLNGSDVFIGHYGMSLVR